MEQAWALVEGASLSNAERESNETIIDARLKYYARPLKGLVQAYKDAGGPAND